MPTQIFTPLVKNETLLSAGVASLQNITRKLRVIGFLGADAQTLLKLTQVQTQPSTLYLKESSISTLSMSGQLLEIAIATALYQKEEKYLKYLTAICQIVVLVIDFDRVQQMQLDLDSSGRSLLWLLVNAPQGTDCQQHVQAHYSTQNGQIRKQFKQVLFSTLNTSQQKCISSFIKSLYCQIADKTTPVLDGPHQAHKLKCAVQQIDYEKDLISLKQLALRVYDQQESKGQVQYSKIASSLAKSIKDKNTYGLMLIYLIQHIKHTRQLQLSGTHKSQEEKCIQEFQKGIVKLSRLWRIGIREWASQFQLLDKKIEPLFDPSQNRVRNACTQELLTAIKALQHMLTETSYVAQMSSSRTLQPDKQKDRSKLKKIINALQEQNNILRDRQRRAKQEPIQHRQTEKCVVASESHAQVYKLQKQLIMVKIEKRELEKSISQHIRNEQMLSQKLAHLENDKQSYICSIIEENKEDRNRLLQQFRDTIYRAESSYKRVMQDYSQLKTNNTRLEQTIQDLNSQHQSKVTLLEEHNHSMSCDLSTLKYQNQELNTRLKRLVQLQSEWQEMLKYQQILQHKFQLAQRDREQLQKNKRILELDISKQKTLFQQQIQQLLHKETAAIKRQQQLQDKLKNFDALLQQIQKEHQQQSQAIHSQRKQQKKEYDKNFDNNRQEIKTLRKRNSQLEAEKELLVQQLNSVKRNFDWLERYADKQASTIQIQPQLQTQSTFIQTGILHIDQKQTKQFTFNDQYCLFLIFQNEQKVNLTNPDEQIVCLNSQKNDIQMQAKQQLQQKVSALQIGIEKAWQEVKEKQQVLSDQKAKRIKLYQEFTKASKQLAKTNELSTIKTEQLQSQLAQEKEQHQYNFNQIKSIFKKDLAYAEKRLLQSQTQRQKYRQLYIDYQNEAKGFNVRQKELELSTIELKHRLAQTILELDQERKTGQYKLQKAREQITQQLRQRMFEAGIQIEEIQKKYSSAKKLLQNVELNFKKQITKLHYQKSPNKNCFSERSSLLWMSQQCRQMLRQKKEVKQGTIIRRKR